MLKAVIAKLDEVEEKYRDLYTAKGDKFELQVEGMKTQGDIDRINAGLTKEKNDHAQTKAELKTTKAKVEAFGELDPDDVTTKLEKLTQLEAAGTNPAASEIQRLISEGVASKIKAETTKLNRQLTEVQQKLVEATGNNEKLTGQIHQRTVDDAVRAAAVGGKVVGEAVSDILLIARADLKLTEDGKVQTEDGRDPTQWLEDRKKTSPYWWPQAVGAGGRPGNGNVIDGKANPFSHEGWNITEQSKMYQNDQRKAETAAQQAGTTIGGPRPAKPA